MDALVVVVFGIVISVLAAIWGVRLCRQRQRDKDALSVLKAIQSGEPAQYGLFLRPFYTTNRIKVTRQEQLAVTGTGLPGMSNQTYNLEETLRHALPVQLVTMGKPGEAYGAGRVWVSENRWKRDVSDLMHHASVIICIPSHHPGTQWELDELVSNRYLTKTVFLMPCDETFFTWGGLRRDWDAALAHMAELGFKVPRYRGKGCLFALRPAVGCFVEGLDLTSPQNLGSAIRRLTEQMPQSMRMDQAAWADCEYREWWYRVVLRRFVPLMFILSVVVSWFAGSATPFFIMGCVALSAAIAVIYWLGIFECPRCHRSFFSRGSWMFQPHRLECVHCGLPMWSNTDVSLWFGRF